jgi:acetyl-CoA acetyltransferase
VAGLNPSAAAQDPVPVLGIATTPLVIESDAVLDELVFDAVSQALREAGVRKQELGLSVTASLDIYDGRSISSGLTNAASGGYLAQSYRIEGDAGQAIIAAAQAIAAGDADLAVAVGVYNPEVSAPDRRAFLQQISNHGFEPHFDRPVGLSADVVLGMHAGHVVDSGELTEEQLAELAAAAIRRGAGRERSVRTSPVTAADVLASAPVSGLLTELMLPAESTGAIAVVLGSLARARRALHPRAVLTGWGQGTADTTASAEWLRDPAAAARRAAQEAYRRAGLTEPADQVHAVELTAATPALLAPTLDALGLAKGVGADRVAPSGGAASSYPGVANGALRLLEAVSWLEDNGGQAVSHSTDLLTGTVSDTATVLVVEGV